MNIKNQLVTKLIVIGKKSKLMKYAAIIIIAVIFAYHHLGQKISANRYRYSGILVAIAVFMFSSSFSSFIYNNETFVSENKYEESKSIGNELTSGVLMLESMPAEEIVDDVESIEVTPSSEDIIIYDDNGQTEAAEFGDDWKLILVNKQNVISDDYMFELGTIRGSIQADTRILGELNSMLDAAKSDGIALVVCSGCRDYGRQTTLFEKKIKNYMSSGMSYFDAYALVSKAVTIPGTSEHQIGLALDIVSSNYTLLNEGFGETAAGIWLKENCFKYGFILRYPKGKEYITGIEYEPWHYRYVGVEAANAITNQEITLEEYVEQIGMK